MSLSSYFMMLLVLVSALLLQSLMVSARWEKSLKLPSDTELEDEVGTRWAVLVTGSNGYGNYRHQADVCHAYQLLKKGGLKDENIVVFMYDDLAHNFLNPRPGVVINRPDGPDVYPGVPKDYTGAHVTAKNLYAVLLGDKTAVEGGSGKVVSSGPNDHIFIYYADHGGPGVLGMPNMPFVYANDFIEVLKKMHKSGSYKEMVIYVEACESGSLFEGVLPEDLNIYVTTASNADESSWGTYCPGMEPSPPRQYITCLGDLYSIAWMEDSETHNLKKKTIQKQYEVVKERTSNHNTYALGSHVMEYGNKTIKSEKLYLYQGFDPSNVYVPDNVLPSVTPMGAVNQRDADLLFLWKRYEQMDDHSEEKTDMLKEITEKMKHRAHLDSSIEFIGKLIFGAQHGPSTLGAVRPSGKALVDDWDCLKSMVQVFETQCGSLTQYGMKHMRALANICNNGISKGTMEEACASACGSSDTAKWGPWNRGYSA